MARKKPIKPTAAGDHIREQAYTELRMCAEDLGKSPTMNEFASHPDTTLHPQSIVKLHGAGGWNAAKRAAGLAVRRHATDRELITLMKTLGEELGRAPSAREINADARLPSTSLYLHRFGSLRAAQKKAGYAKQTASGTSTEQMLEYGIALAKELGQLPGWNDWVHARKTKKDMPSEWQVYRRFGGSEGAWRMFTYYILEVALEQDVSLDTSDSPEI